MLGEPIKAKQNELKKEKRRERERGSFKRCRGAKMVDEGVVVARYLWLYSDRFRLDRRGRIEMRRRA